MKSTREWEAKTAPGCAAKLLFRNAANESAGRQDSQRDLKPRA